jgi:hypothetical protein
VTIQHHHHSYCIIITRVTSNESIRQSWQHRWPCRVVFVIIKNTRWNCGKWQGQRYCKNTAIMMEMLGVQSQVVGGMPLPEWLAGWQINSGMAEERITELVNAE